MSNKLKLKKNAVLFETKIIYCVFLVVKYCKTKKVKADKKENSTGDVDKVSLFQANFQDLFQDKNLCQHFFYNHFLKNNCNIFFFNFYNF